MAGNDIGLSCNYRTVLCDDTDGIFEIFKLYMYTAFAPIPLSSFAGEATSFMGKAFIKSYMGVCMEGAVIVLACLIFSAFTSSGNFGLVDAESSAVVQVLAYLAETIFNMLVLVGLIKGSDRIVKEMFAL